MSQYRSQFRLDYAKYFDNPPNNTQVPSTTGDNNNILNFARTVRNDDDHSAKLNTNEDKAVIPTTTGDIEAAQYIREKSTNGKKPEQNITKAIGGGIVEDLKDVQSSVDTLKGAEGGAISPPANPITTGKYSDDGGSSSATGTSVAGAMAFSTKSLPVAGALAFNNAALEKLKKGDNIKGAGPVTAAAVSALISAAPQIISAIKDYRKSTTKGGKWIQKCEGSGVYKTYVKGLNPEKIDELEALCKKIRGQGRYLSGAGDIGSGKFGTFMSNAWNKLKGIYNSEQFKPIKSALLKAASNTASNYINKAADKVASKTGNQDLKDVINVTRDTALNAKNELINQAASGDTGGSMIAADVNDENVDGVRLFEESICFDPVEVTPNKIYSAKRLSCPRGLIEGAGSCKGYKIGRNTRISL